MQEIIIHEVGLRDGLQIEKDIVQFEKKLEWINNLSISGVDIIQVGSFVHPEKVPQMADTDRLFKELSTNKISDVIFSGLVLNEKGLERGMNCGVEMFCMGVSASETHSRKNTGMGTDEASKRIIDMGLEALKAKKQVQVSVQSAFGCSYEGKISERRVISIVEKFIEAGFKNISLSDTAGHADPILTEKIFTEAMELDPSVEYACHFHNTFGMGMVNTFTAIKIGVKYHETAFAGLGGCPFTAVTGGNVCTEDFVHMLQRMNIRKDITLERFIEVSKDASKYLGRELPGIIYKTGEIGY